MKQLNEYSSTELKALAYDFLLQLQNVQNNMKVVNEALTAKLKEEQESKKPEEPVAKEKGTNGKK